MRGSLRKSLIGAWELIDVVEEPVDGSPARFPMGERATGLLVYAADGHMSVQIMHEGHAEGRTADDAFDRASDDYEREARTYFAYAGTYALDEVSGLVTHRVRLSLFPGWVGKDQERIARLEDGVLQLTAEPSLSGGVLVQTRIRWRRAGGPAASGA